MSATSPAPAPSPAADHRPARPRRRRPVAVALLLLVSLVAASCGGTSKDKAATTRSFRSLGLTAADGESGLDDAGTPTRGGKLVYGLEAESGGGFCLPEGQLAISGMMVVRAVYDTLTVPNSKGDYVPYLAKGITHSDDYRTWDIELRDGVTFSDGSPLTAEVVKNNLDAYRGKYPTRKPLLFLFVFDNITETEVTGPLTVRVRTKVPWAAFPAYLYSSSRLGIMGQAQLDDADTCYENLIGTGPFNRNVRWKPNEELTADANPDYWQTAPDGKPYPYANSIEFRPIPDGTVRMNALESGEINVLHSSNAENIGGRLYDLREKGKANMFVSEDQAEVGFLQLNSGKAPFDDIRIRKALAMGLPREQVAKSLADGLATVADGPFPKGSPGYLEDPGFPKYDLKAAKRLIADYRADGKDPNFTLTHTTEPSVVRFAETVQARAKKLGLNVRLIPRDQAALIDDAIGRKYEAMTFRNYPGGDPDSNYVWFYRTDKNPVNFQGHSDAVLSKLLDQGRAETDPAKRKAIYQDVNRRFAEQVWNIWWAYTPWAIVSADEVHGVLGPPLPGDDPSKPGPRTTDDPARRPSTGLATGHPLLGLWVEK
jgi:peptide/nickel transport system substrate-binding protein